MQQLKSVLIKSNTYFFVYQMQQLLSVSIKSNTLISFLSIKSLFIFLRLETKKFLPLGVGSERDM